MKTARTVKYFAEALKFCLQNGLDLSPKDLAPYMKKQTLSDFKDIISSLPDEEFEEWLGKDQMDRVRKRNLKKIKQLAETPNKVVETAKSGTKKEDKPQQIPMRDFFRKLGG